MVVGVLTVAVPSLARTTLKVSFDDRQVPKITLVDRSAAYAARWVAKSLVKGGFAKRALVQVSYAIGVARPMSIYVNSYQTSQYSDADLTKIVEHNFDLRPGAIVK